MDRSIQKIEILIETAYTRFFKKSIQKKLKEVLKKKWSWDLKKDIEEKFFNRFTNFNQEGAKFTAFDNKKKRKVILDPSSKAFIIIPNTKKPCKFLQDAVRTSKNKYQLEGEV